MTDAVEPKFKKKSPGRMMLELCIKFWNILKLYQNLDSKSRYWLDAPGACYGRRSLSAARTLHLDHNRWVYCRLLPRLIVYLAPNIERSVREERICYKRAALIFVWKRLRYRGAPFVRFKIYVWRSLNVLHRFHSKVLSLYKVSTTIKTTSLSNWKEVLQMELMCSIHLLSTLSFPYHILWLWLVICRLLSRS